MSGDFVDSNIFIYSLDRRSPEKRAIARQVVQEALDGEGVISFQVVQETLNVICKKLPGPFPDDEVRDFLDTTLLPMLKVMPSRDLYHSALDVHARYRYSFYDSMILSAALLAGCARILSEDLHPGQEIRGLRIENPFAALA